MTKLKKGCALCMKCGKQNPKGKGRIGKQVKMTNIGTPKKLKNGAYQVKGECEKCSGNVYRFISASDKDEY